MNTLMSSLVYPRQYKNIDIIHEDVMFDETADAIRAQLALVQALLAGYLTAGVEVLRSFDPVEELRQDTKAVGESVTQLITIGTTLLVGVLVLSQIVTAIPENNGAFSGAVIQIETVLNSSFLLAAILPLVIIAGAVLFYVRRFNMGGGGGGGRMNE